MKNETQLKKSKISYAKYGYYFVLPFFIAYIIFSLYPTIFTAIIGFTDLKGSKSTFHFLKGSHVFDNFKQIFKTVKSAEATKTQVPLFVIALKNTFKIWICNFIPQMILALLLAAWFTNTRVKIPGQGAFKVMFYLPNIITAATIAILFSALFGYPMGPVNDLLQRFGFIEQPINFLISKKLSQGIVIFIQTWMWYGYTMIIIISGILGISPDIFEAAEIDGASGWQVFWRITIPNIKTIMLFTLITSLIGGLNMFDIPQLFNLGGPDRSTTTVNVFIYSNAFKGTYRYNVAAAASMVVFLIIVALSAIIFYLMRDKEEAELNKLKKQQIKEARKQAKLAKARG